jgi:hypothetical protein
MSNKFKNILKRLEKFLDSQSDVKWAYIAGDTIDSDDYRFDGGAIILESDEEKFVVFLRKIKKEKI